MSQRQQPDDGAASLLLAATGEQRSVLAIGIELWPATAQRHQRGRAEKAFEPIVVPTHAQAMANHARAPNRTPF